MESFVAIVDAGSFSAAARRLGVGQPTLSRTVMQLEERLETRLLVRSTRGLAPTEAGMAFYERARRAIDEADAAETAARAATQGFAGNLRVAAAVTFGRLHLIPRLGEFLAAHPKLAVELLLDDSNLDLREEGIDVALRMGALGDSAMTARRLAVGRRIVLGTPEYFTRHGRPASPDDLPAHEAVIHARSGGDQRWRFERDGEERQVVVDGRLRISAAEGVRAAVLSGLGLVISTEWMFAPELASGEVVQVLTDWLLPPIDLWAVFPAGRRASAKTRAFVGFVEKSLARSGFTSGT
jgi:DNA-binding transcriptional LysR family regulator